MSSATSSSTRVETFVERLVRSGITTLALGTAVFGLVLFATEWDGGSRPSSSAYRGRPIASGSEWVRGRWISLAVSSPSVHEDDLRSDSGFRSAAEGPFDDGGFDREDSSDRTAVLRESRERDSSRRDSSRRKQNRTKDRQKLDPPLEEEAPTSKRVVVRKGDSYWKLAQRYLGSGLRHPEIEALNAGVPPERLREGIEVWVPIDRGGADAIRSRRAEDRRSQKTRAETKRDENKNRVPAKPRKHIVRRGDSLTELALKYLGTSKRWTEIRDLNRSKIIGDDGIREGMVLVIPPKERP